MSFSLLWEISLSSLHTPVQSFLSSFLPLFSQQALFSLSPLSEFLLSTPRPLSQASSELLWRQKRSASLCLLFAQSSSLSWERAVCFLFFFVIFFSRLLSFLCLRRFLLHFLATLLSSSSTCDVSFSISYHISASRYSDFFFIDIEFLLLPSSLRYSVSEAVFDIIEDWFHHDIFSSLSFSRFSEASMLRFLAPLFCAALSGIVSFSLLPIWFQLSQVVSFDIAAAFLHFLHFFDFRQLSFRWLPVQISGASHFAFTASETDAAAAFASCRRYIFMPPRSQATPLAIISLSPCCFQACCAWVFLRYCFFFYTPFQRDSSLQHFSLYWDAFADSHCLSCPEPPHFLLSLSFTMFAAYAFQLMPVFFFTAQPLFAFAHFLRYAAFTLITADYFLWFHFLLRHIGIFRDWHFSSMTLWSLCFSEQSLHTKAYQPSAVTSHITEPLYQAQASEQSSLVT